MFSCSFDRLRSRRACLIVDFCQSSTFVSSCKCAFLSFALSFSLSLFPYFFLVSFLPLFRSFFISLLRVFVPSPCLSFSFSFVLSSLRFVVLFRTCRSIVRSFFYLFVFILLVWVLLLFAPFPSLQDLLFIFVTFCFPVLSCFHFVFLSYIRSFVLSCFCWQSLFNHFWLSLLFPYSWMISLVLFIFVLSLCSHVVSFFVS